MQHETNECVLLLLSKLFITFQQPCLFKNKLHQENKKKEFTFFCFLSSFWLLWRRRQRLYTRLITWHVMRVTYACRSSSKSLGDLIWNHVHSASSDAHAVNSIYSICDARVSHWAIISIGTLIVKLPSHSIETKMYIRVCWERERERESQEKKIRAGYYIAEWATSSPVELLCWPVRLYRSRPAERRQWNASIQADDIYVQ